MTAKCARPILKWPGGKRQLLEQFDRYYPKELKTGAISHYFEPFFGGGAVFFKLSENTCFKRANLSDANPDLIQLYQTVKSKLGELQKELALIKTDYLSLKEKARSKYFYDRRTEYNHLRIGSGKNEKAKSLVRQSALLIFLNKTCFNGLYRLNSSGGFNSPVGKYKNPSILDTDNLQSVSLLLNQNKAHLDHYDYQQTLSLVKKLGKEAKNAFVYFDPPYRPVSKTASFTSYFSGRWDDSEQIKLALLFKELDSLGAKVMLSNADTKDGFFEKHYSGYTINKVTATRSINSNAKKRGRLTELLITNY